MNLEKHNQMLKVDKFETITFALDYIENVRKITKSIEREDILDSLIALYDTAFRNGSRDVLDRQIHSLYKEIDNLEEQA